MRSSFVLNRHLRAYCQLVVCVRMLFSRASDYLSSTDEMRQASLDDSAGRLGERGKTGENNEDRQREEKNHDELDACVCVCVCDIVKHVI